MEKQKKEHREERERERKKKEEKRNRWLHSTTQSFLIITFRLIRTELNVFMADGNSHPFNENVIATDTIVQLQKPLPHHHYQQQHQTTSKHKDLIDLLSSNNTSNHVLNSKDNISSHAVFDNDFNRLKSIIRSTIWPIDDHIRRTLWMNILTLNRVRTSKQHRSVHHTLEGSISTVSIPIDYSSNLSTLTLDQWPNFVDETNLCFYHLIEPTGYLKLQRILFTFSLNHPDLTYCPTLEPISCLLLHYFNEHQVLYLMNRLLLRHWLCAETRLQWEANCNAFQNLLKLYYVKSNIFKTRKMKIFIF